MKRDERWEMMYLLYKRQIAKQELTPTESDRLNSLLELSELEKKARAEKKQKGETK